MGYDIEREIKKREEIQGLWETDGDVRTVRLPSGRSADIRPRDDLGTEDPVYEATVYDTLGRRKDQHISFNINDLARWSAGELAVTEVREA